MKKVVLFVFFAFISQVYCLDFHDFDKYQKIYTKEEMEKKIKTFLSKDDKVTLFYRFDNEAFYIGDLEHEKIDYILHLSSSCSEKPQTIKRPLLGAKIAIDPGHFGGVYAELEERVVKISKDLVGAENDVHFDEGTLTFLTALELKRLLENEGAHVFITKPNIGAGAIERNFFAWLENQPDLWKKNETLTSLFRIYNREDLKERARKINEFQPDVTIVIHYNAHDENEKQQLITHANYNLVFIPGAFKKNELSTPEERYEFLRLAVTNDIEQSLILSQYVTEEFTQKLKVPLITEDHKNSYLRSSSLKISEGIYSRNLALTRMVHSPLCYGETLIQNNEHESIKLDTKDAEINSVPCSSRIKIVADAYFEGIKKYFSK